ncbi:MAG TPA: hypothetical protein VHZ55_25175 [Bryobacteraceae bacterium]|nr:hypothetical protein [Bryobacteraceae bacterium]
MEKKRMRISVFGQVNDERELHAYGIVGMEEHTEGIVQFITNSFCLLCFGRDAADKKMWTDYGDCGRGICLGLDVKRNMIDDITYVPEKKWAEFPPGLIEDVLKQKRFGNRSRKTTPIEKQAMDYVRPFALTKFDKYKDEEECRAFLKRDEEEGGHYYAKLGAQGMYLQEVILGNRCTASEDHVKMLVASYSRQPIAVRRSEAHYDE